MSGDHNTFNATRVLILLAAGKHRHRHSLDCPGTRCRWIERKRTGRQETGQQG